MVVLGLGFGGGMGVGGRWAAGFGGGRPGWWLAVRPPALAGRFRTPRKAQELDIDRFRQDCEKIDLMSNLYLNLGLPYFLHFGIRLIKND